MTKRKKQHKKSLAILAKWIKETPPEEITALVKKHCNNGIEGPTVDKYLEHIKKLNIG